jgi:hypothetical protein
MLAIVSINAPVTARAASPASAARQPHPSSDSSDIPSASFIMPKPWLQTPFVHTTMSEFQANSS